MIDRKGYEEAASRRGYSDKARWILINGQVKRIHRVHEADRIVISYVESAASRLGDLEQLVSRIQLDHLKRNRS